MQPDNINFNHPWVQDYIDYEAVLVCENELQFWAEDSVIRAFQTYLFRDTSDDNDIIEITHNETGSIIQYDGNILAIRFSESFVDMLPDMVRALHSLGWRSATAFHHPETIALFMEDIGHAIPASIDFDVKPAGRDTNIAQYPQGASLLAKHQLKDITAKEQLDIIDEEFRNLENAPGVITFDAEKLKPKQPIILIEDEDFANIFSDVFTIKSDRLQPRIKEPTVKTFESSEDTPIFRIPDETQQEPGIRHSEQSTDGDTNSSKGQPDTGIFEDTLNIIKLGNGYLLFDVPKMPLPDLSISEMFGENFNDASTYVHLHTGQMNNALHWDLLREIPQDNPEFALTLVKHMQLSGHDPYLLSCLLANISRMQQQFDLRDVLNIIIEKRAGNTFDDEDYKGSSVLISSTATKLIDHSDYTGTLQALMKYLGYLSLIKDGECMLDLKLDSNSNKQTVNTFTLRGLITKESPWIYFVHLKQNDTLLAKWMTQLLYELACHLRDAN